MEPTSFNVGDDWAKLTPTSISLLQWSRRLSTSETSRSVGIAAPPDMLQWSRRLSTSETVASGLGTDAETKRFNGADVFQRRRPRPTPSREL